MRYLLTKILLVVVLASLPIQVFSQNDFPEKPISWVSDYYDLLNNNQEIIINNKLKKLEKSTSTQIFLAIFGKISEKYYVEEYAVKLYEKWRPGRENEDNGVLIVVFAGGKPGERKIRIETGYGLEGVLTDLQSARVIDEIMIPEFKKGNYFAGIDKGIDIIIAAVKGEYTIPVETKSKSKRTNWISLLVVFFVIVSILRRFGGRGTTISRKGSRYSRTAWGGPFFFGGGGGGSSFGGGGGGFSGGFGGLSGGGGASGSW